MSAIGGAIWYVLITVVMYGVLYKSLCAVYRGLLYCYYKGGIHMNGVLYFGYKHFYPQTNICIKGIPFGGKLFFQHIYCKAPFINYIPTKS